MTTPDALEPLDRSGLAAVTGAATLMGLGSVIAKAADMSGPVLALHRSWGAAVLYLTAFLALKGRISVRSLRAALPGGAMFGMQLALFFSAISLTTVANATVIIALQPIVILLFVSRRFGEPVGSTDLLLSAIAVVGVIVVVFGSSTSPTWSPAGDLLAVGALGTWTAYFALSKRAREQLGAVEYQGLSLIFSSLAILPVALLFSGTVDPGPGKWWWIVAMVATPGTGHLLMNWAHPRVPISVISLLTLLSPVIAIGVAAFALDGEGLNVTQIVGMAIVLGALASSVRGR